MPATVLLAVCSLALPAQDSERGADEQAQFVAALAEQGLHDLVLREARVFLDRHPRHAGADHVRYRLAGALFELGRFQEASRELGPLLRVPGFEFAREVAFRTGQCALELSDLTAAEAAFRGVLERDPKYLATPATFLLGETLFRKGEVEAAIESYRVARAAPDAGDYAREADHALTWCAFELGRWDEAVRLSAAFLKAWPDDGRRDELTYLAGEAQLEAGRPREALEAFDRVGEGEHHARAQRGAAFALVALERPRDAAARFAALLERYPEGAWVAEARLHMGIQLHEAGEEEAALRALEGDAEGLGAERAYWRSRVLAALGRHAEALEALQLANALARKDPGTAGGDPELERRIRVARGDALFELGRVEEAAASYAEAGTDYALHSAAVAHLARGDAQAAERMAQALLQQTSEESWRIEALWSIAEARFLAEDWAAGEEHFGRLVEGDARPERAARAASRRAWCAWMAGRAEVAAERFAEVHTRWPDSPEAEEARYMQARALEDGEQPAPAAAHYASYLERHPTGGHVEEAGLRLARLEGEDGRRRLESLVQRAQSPQVLVPARYELAELLARQGEHAEAAGHYEALLESAPDDPLAAPAAYGAAWSRWSLGDNDAAVRHLRALLGRDDLPTDLASSALELLVWAERDAGRLPEARRAYEIFVERCSDEARRFALARVVATALREAGSADRAHRLYEALLERTQDREVAVGVCIERAWIDLEQEQVEAAEAQARLAARHAPEHPQLAELFFFLGEGWFERADDEKACADYAVAAAHAPPEIVPRALYKLGFAELRRGRNDEAARAFASLVEGHAGDELCGEALFLLGEALLRADRVEAAVAPLERLRNDHPRHAVLPKALLRLGTAYAQLERWRESADVLARLLREHAGFEGALEAELTRGRALARLRESRAARQCLARVIDGDRGQLAARARLALGRLELEEGDAEAALSEFLKVALLYAHAEEVAEALYLAGEVLESRDDREAALARYREAAEKHAGTVFGRAARERLSNIEE